MSSILLNCEACQADKHEECSNPDSCLCAVETDHNANLKPVESSYGVWTDEDRQKFKDSLKEEEYTSFRYEKRRPQDRIDDTVELLNRRYSFLTIRKTEEILMFDGKIYSSEKAKSVIKETTEQLLENCTEHERNEVLAKIKAQTYTDIDEFDNDSNLITLENGILNLDTLELSKHTPDNYSRVLLPLSYIEPKFPLNEASIFDDLEKNLKDTLFWKSLKACFTIDEEFDQESFESVLEMTSSIFLKKQIDERAFMNEGKGENGKSVFIEYIESLLGKANVSRIPLHELSESQFLSAELESKLANIYTDLESNELKKSGKLKVILSGEGFQAQRKYQQPFILYPFAKLIFSCNRFPKVFDQSQGFFRRWIIIKWQRNFENDKERDEQLKIKLQNQDEKNFVFSCLIALARILNQRGTFTHSKEWKVIQREWNQNADPLDEFATNYIVESDGYKTKRETYHFYKKYCYEIGETPLGIGQFGKRFAEYYDDDKVERARVWLNIDFVEPKDSTVDEFWNQE